jgi:di/tricarboxylate transporter
MDNIVVGVVVIALGLFSICGAVFQWSFFMEDRKARRLIGIFGRQPVRIFYMILGSMFFICGAMLALGIDGL